jgi:hypothetical protein
LSHFYLLFLFDQIRLIAFGHDELQDMVKFCTPLVICNNLEIVLYFTYSDTILGEAFKPYYLIVCSIS